METRVIKTLGRTGRITRAQAFKVAKKVLRPRSDTKPRKTKILTPASTASGKGLIKFRGARVAP